MVPLIPPRYRKDERMLSDLTISGTAYLCLLPLKAMVCYRYNGRDAIRDGRRGDPGYEAEPMLERLTHEPVPAYHNDASVARFHVAMFRFPRPARNSDHASKVRAEGLIIVVLIIVHTYAG